MIHFELKYDGAHYKFELLRKITLISDLSATNKTRLLTSYAAARNEPTGTTLISCGAETVILLNDTEDVPLEVAINGASDGSLIIVDEYPQKEINRLSSIINKKPCWFLFITRELPFSVHVSVSSVCTMVDVDGIFTLKPAFSEITETVTPICVRCEGIGSEEKFYKFFANDSMHIQGIGGNGGINGIVRNNTIPGMLLIADGSSLGFLIVELLKWQRIFHYHMYLPESFEWVLMLSDYFDKDELICKLRLGVENVLDHRHESSERYLYSLMCDRDVFYNKKNLPDFLHGDGGRLSRERMQVIWERIGVLDFSQIGSNSKVRILDAFRGGNKVDIEEYNSRGDE